MMQIIGWAICLAAFFAGWNCALEEYAWAVIFGLIGLVLTFISAIEPEPEKEKSDGLQ